MAKLGNFHFEIIYVNDGSSDGSMAKLIKLAKQDQRLKILSLSRNFGHQAALTAGLDYANGDAVITMDSDLQDPPEVCLSLIREWQKGFDVVYAKRRRRLGDTYLKIVTAWLFYRLLNRLSDIEIPADVGDFRLLDRKVVEQLRNFHEHHRFLRGIVSYLGFKQTVIEFERHRRQAGDTKYPFNKMWRLATDAITGFSTSPLRLASRLGYLVAFFSLFGIFYVLSVKIFTPQRAVPGWAFITIAIFFMGGVQLIMLGILGHYIGRTYTQSQNRPIYIVESVYGLSKKG